MAALIVTLLLFPLAGRLLARHGLGEAFLLGVGFVGSLLFVAGALHVPLAVALGAVVVAVVALSFRAAKTARNPLRLATTARTGGGFLASLGMTVAILPLLAALFIAAVIPLNDFDGRVFWVLKAKALAQERSMDAPFFHGATVDPRNRYPLLVPLDGAVLLTAAHSIDDRHVRWLYLGIFAALVLLVRRRVGVWPAALLAWIPQFLTEPEGGVLSAYNDIAVAAFAAGALFELIDGESPLQFSIWIVFLVFTKSEGLPLALIFLAAGAYVFRRRVRLPAACFAAATAALFFWRYRVPHSDEEDVLSLLPTLPHKLDRLGGALAAFPSHMFVFAHWGIFWSAAIAASFFAFRADRRAAALAMSILVAMAALYVAVYVVTDWVQADLIAVTADRLLMHMTPAALVLIALGWRGATGAPARSR